MVDFTDVTVPGTTLVTFSIDPPIAVPANFVLTSPLVPMSVGYLDVSTTGVPHRAHHHLRFDEGVQGFLPASPVIESCEAKGATKYARTTAAVSGCASCLDGRAGLLASRLGTFADQMNGSIYCDGAVSFP